MLTHVLEIFCLNQHQLSWADPGILPGGSRPNCQITALTFFFFLFFFSPQLILQFYSGYQWFISKKTIIFKGFRGGPTFSRGGGGPGPSFSGGGGGVQLFPGGGLYANLYRDPKNL